MIKYYKKLISFVFYFATAVITIVVADNATHFFCKKDLMGMQDYSCFLEKWQWTIYMPLVCCFETVNHLTKMAGQ